MSSYEQRAGARGVSHRIRFRYQGKNKNQPFQSADAAMRWKALLDAVGPAKALAAIAADTTAVGPSVRTVAEQVTNHIAHLTGISDGTRKRYTGYLDRRIASDPIGRTPLPLCDRDACSAWVNRLATDKTSPLAAKSIRNHHSLLSDSLRSAVRDGLIPYNPAEGIRIETPDVDDADEMTTLTLPELWQFIGHVGEHWRPMVTFMFGTGVRWQEASALQVKDVDLELMQARIVRAWKDTAGQGHQLGKPKSKRSRRTIVFGQWVADVLEPLIAGRKPDAFVFTNTRGGPVRYSNFNEDVWGKAVHAFAGDEKITTPVPRGRPRVSWKTGPGKRPTPHDARHTYASLQIARGASMAFLQRQLGHESINTTINLYTHLQTEDLRPLADVIDVPLELEPPS